MYSERTHTTGLEGVSHILDLAYNTDMVNKPLGVILVGEPGIGKTMVIQNYKYENSVIVNDVTGPGFWDLMAQRLHKHKRGFIIVPDMGKVLARKKSQENFMWLVNIASEEGMQRTIMHKVDVDFGEKVFYGLIGAMTTETYSQHREIFESSGFISRHLIVNYGYSEKTITTIQNNIMKGYKPQEYTVKCGARKEISTPLDTLQLFPDDLSLSNMQFYIQKHNLVNPKNTITKAEIEKALSFKKSVTQLAYHLKKSRDDKFGFRATKHIIALLKSQAYIEGVDRVDFVHLGKIACILPFLMGRKYDLVATQLDEKPSYTMDEDYFTMHKFLNKEKLQDQYVKRLMNIGLLRDTAQGLQISGGGL